MKQMLIKIKEWLNPKCSYQQNCNDKVFFKDKNLKLCQAHFWYYLIEKVSLPLTKKEIKALHNLFEMWLKIARKDNPNA